MSDDELRAFRRQWYRTIRVLYWMALGVYTAAFALFVHEGNLASAIQMVTLAVVVSLGYWFSRAIAKARGDL